MRAITGGGALFVAILLSIPTPTPAQTTADEETFSGGFLFAYQPNPGERQAFEEGYRRHLDWHRENADSLAWYGWTVLAGPRLGQFVDGAFGMPFAAIDARVDPAGDATNAAETFRPHGTPTGRELLLLRRELSTATPLEDLAPRPFVQVVQYSAGPDGAGRLERAFRAMRGSATADSLLPYTVYERLVGGESGFVLMIWRDRIGTFDDVRRNPERGLRARVAEGEVDVTSELWRYRPELTYLGPEEIR